VPLERKSRFAPREEDKEESQTRSPEAAAPVRKVSPTRSAPQSKEEILEEMTLVLRRTLTEILLDVTSQVRTLILYLVNIILKTHVKKGVQ